MFRPLAFTLCKVFLKNKKRSGPTFPASLTTWFLKKNILDTINWPNFMACLLVFLEILRNRCIVFICCPVWDNLNFDINVKKKTLKNFMAPFYGWGSTASRLQPLRGGSLLFTIQFPEIPGTHFINLRRMKGWVNLGATQWFWTRDSWIGNPGVKWCMTATFKLIFLRIGIRIHKWVWISRLMFCCLCFP